MTPSVSVFDATRAQVGESPLWDAGRHCLWWVDVQGRCVLRSDGAKVRRLDVALPPGALALTASGDVVLAAGTGWHALDIETGALHVIATQALPARSRMNDGVTDARGRFWTGTLQDDRAPVGELLCLDGGAVRVTQSGLRTQNGCAISPDGRTFWMADSHPDVCTIWAFDFDLDSGTLTNRRLFHRPARGRPDGAAVDVDGCYWYAAVDGGCLVRLDPEGRQMQVTDLPVSRPTKPAFGGADLSTLFVTSMSIGTEPAREPLAGCVFAVDAGVRGHPVPRLTPQRARPHPAPEHDATI